MSLTNEQESHLDGTQKNWTQPVYVKTAQKLISRMDDKRLKVFNAHQGKFGTQWLNVVPCKNLILKLDDQQLRISIDLRLCANICVEHTCHCDKRVERDGLYGLWSLLTSCYSQFSHKADIGIYRLAFNARTAPTVPNRWQTPRRCYHDSLGNGWNVTVVNALAPSRLNQGSLCNPGTTATEAEVRKIETYCQIIDNGYIFQPVALEAQGFLGESSEILGGCK